MEVQSIRIESSYRERLSPSLWLLVAAGVCAPMAALVFAPVDTTLALVIGILVGMTVIAALVALSPRVEVEGATLRAGSAHIDVALLGTPVPASGDAARAARGTELNPRSWILIRGGIDGTVTIPVLDENDPAPAWVISSRTPDRLAAAVVNAQIRRRTPST